MQPMIDDTPPQPFFPYPENRPRWEYITSAQKRFLADAEAGHIVIHGEFPSFKGIADCNGVRYRGRTIIAMKFAGLVIPDGQDDLGRPRLTLSAEGARTLHQVRLRQRKKPVAPH